MLLEFSVKNFLSFKDKVTLSMIKGSGNELENNIIFNSIEDTLKCSAIYGANASGKSNIIKAIKCAISMVRNSNLMAVDDKWDIIKPFLLDNETKNSPSEFEFVFVTNNIKYKYFFSATIDKIYDESLVAYYSQKPTSIFSRKNTSDYEFTIDKNKLEAIKLRNTDNKLFLSTATTWNYDKTKDVFLWFTNVIDIYLSFDKISRSKLINYTNSDLKEFTLKLLKEADILIENIYINYEDNFNVELEHVVVDDSHKNHYYKLNFNDESSGTKILFALAPFLQEAFTNQRILIIDELEKSMHPALVEFIIKLFNNEQINKANSQLIFTTHAVYLLNLKLLRRDQIWFTEKNPNTGISLLYPLDSFSVRKDENVEKGYINGRYGAIPFIKDIDLWLEDM